MLQPPHRRVFKIAAIAVGLVALLFILRFYVFTISHVQVVGNRMISLKEVAQSAGP